MLAALRADGRLKLILGAAGVLLALFVLVGALAALRLVRAGDQLRDARDLLRSAGTAIEQGRLEGAFQQLTEAQRLLTAANGSLHGRPELAAVGWVPFVSPNLSELRDGVSLALQLADGGRRILVESGPLQAPDGSLEVPLRSGAIPLDAVERVGTEAAALAAQLPASGEMPRRYGLVGPIRSARDFLYDEVRERRSQLTVLGDALRLIAEMAGGNGPRRYLLAVANTAEMRGSGGMVLNYGVLEGRDGAFELGAFGRIDDLRIPEPISDAQVDPDYLRRWDGFDVLRQWRNANMAADFTVVAPVLEEMYRRATGLDVHGVIQIDPDGLAAILEGTGPVQVPELGTVTADNVVELVLHEAYRRFPDIDTRTDVLGDVAEAAFRRLVEGDYASLRPLGEALVGAVEERHLMMHSPFGDVAGVLGRLAASGTLPAPTALDSVHLTAQNISGNKLDYYVETELALSGERPPGEVGRLRAEVTLRNTAPPAETEPRYIFGPFDETQVVGEYRTVVTLYLPAGTTLEDAGGGPVYSDPVALLEDGRVAVTWWVNLPAGTSNTVTLDLLVPPRPNTPYELVAVPSPRVRPTALTVDINTGSRHVRTQEALERTLRLRPDT